MITLCYAAKGGSGTTVVACGRAINTAGPSLLVDLVGDVPAMLGIAEPQHPGVIDWLQSNAPAERLDHLLIDMTPASLLLPASGPFIPDGRRSANASLDSTVGDDRWVELLDWLVGWAHDTGGSVVIDAGTSPNANPMFDQCDHRWLVTRPCYLALKKSSQRGVTPTGVVMIREPGRRLKATDIETSTGAPVIAKIPWDTRIAHATDSGLLLSRGLPRSVFRTLAKAAA